MKIYDMIEGKWLNSEKTEKKEEKERREQVELRLCLVEHEKKVLDIRSDF